MNQEKRFSKNIEIIEDLSKDSILRRLDANCLVFIKKWIEIERKDAKKELLKDWEKELIKELEILNYADEDCEKDKIYIQAMLYRIGSKLDKLKK